MLFAFRLARQCGYPHPRMMLEQMTSSEFAEAMAYAAIDPCGEFREELRHGQLMHLLDAAHFKRDAPLRPLDFMNFTENPEDDERELTNEELEAYAAQVFGV